MKTFFLLSTALFFSFKINAQSILIQPNKMESKQSTATDNIILQSNNQPSLIGKRHSGTLTTPTAVGEYGDLLAVQGSGYNGTTFTGPRGSISFEATQNWTTTNNGTRIKFFNTPNGSTNLTERMVINQNGNVGIGVSTPSYKLELLQDSNSDDGIGLNRLGGDAPAFFGIGYNGTTTSPSATQNTNILARFGARGYNGTSFTSSRARIDMVANQNWTSTANGTEMKFYTTTNGTNAASEQMVIKGNGKVGIGTSDPQARIHVDGDIILGIKDYEAPFSNTDLFGLNREGKSIIRFKGTNSVLLNGILGGVDGLVLYIFNYQDVNLTIMHEGSSAQPENRIWTGNAGNNLYFSGRGGATLIYDGLNQRWRVISYND